MSALDNLINAYADLLPNQPKQGLGLGKNVRFSDNPQGVSSEIAWMDFVRDLNKYFETQGTIPVDKKKFFPNDINLISTVGMLHPGAEAYLQGYNMDLIPDAAGYYAGGKARYTPEWARTYGDESDSTLAITDPGYESIRWGQQSVDMHEYLHHIDSLLGDTTTEPAMTHHEGTDPVMPKDASEIMKSYIQASGSPLTADELYNLWMNDPASAHLDLDDPGNEGLRELLLNRSHHGGVVDPREGFGIFLATALSDPGYQSEVLRRYSQDDQDYYLSGQEVFARAGSNVIRPPSSMTFDEGFTPGLFQGMDKGLADSLATYLNSMR